MTRADKTTAIAELKAKFSESSFFYLTDASTMTVEQVSKLRRMCFENDVEMKVIKNTLAIKALNDQPEEKGFQALKESLKGPTAIMFSNVANLPAKLLKDFRGPKGERPILKAAYIDTDVFIGDDQLKTLAALKSKEDLIGELIGLLQSPIKNVIGSLQSGGNTISGLLKALEQRGEQ